MLASAHGAGSLRALRTAIATLRCHVPLSGSRSTPWVFCRDAVRGRCDFTAFGRSRVQVPDPEVRRTTGVAGVTVQWAVGRILGVRSRSMIWVLNINYDLVAPSYVAGTVGCSGMLARDVRLTRPRLRYWRPDGGLTSACSGRGRALSAAAAAPYTRLRGRAAAAASALAADARFVRWTRVHQL